MLHSPYSISCASDVRRSLKTKRLELLSSAQQRSCAALCSGRGKTSNFNFNERWRRDQAVPASVDDTSNSYPAGMHALLPLTSKTSCFWHRAS